MTDPTGDQPPRSLVAAFATHAAARPAAVAVVDGDVRMPYRDLALAAEGVRRQLLAAGVGPGSRVGISMNRSWRLVAAVVGVLAAGASYVPLDPSYPAARLGYIADDSGVDVVCVDAGAAVTVGRVAIEVDGALADRPVDTAEAHLGGYVIYTSGSTGRPKGVPIPQGHVLELFDAAAEHFDVGPDDVWTLFHSYSFDFSVWELWGALLHGGTVVLLADADARDPRRLLGVLEAERVSVLSQVPSAFKYVVRAYERGPVPLRALRYVVFGGEALDKPSVRRWLALRDGPETLVDMYGITETTVHVTHAVVRADDVADDAAPTRIGRPLRHLRVALVAEDGRLAGPGEPGEIYVAGSSLTPGYLGRPDLDAQRFVHLDLGDGARRWYRSGDLASRSADGELSYLGRIDAQVQLRGFRIEAGEIEAVLREGEAVADAAVTVATLPSGERILAALVTPGEEGRLPSIGELRRMCGARLPAYMVPDRFVPVAEIPTTPSGKVDRAALADVALGRAVVRG